MVERTRVYLSVLRSQENDAEDLFGNLMPDDTGGLGNPDTTVFTFDEVYRGELPFLHKLRATGIAYDSSWEGTESVSSATEHLRFTSGGGVVERTIFDNELNPPLERLLALCGDPLKLQDYVVSYSKQLAVLPWDNQEEYGKLYRTNKLIGV